MLRRADGAPLAPHPKVFVLPLGPADATAGGQLRRHTQALGQLERSDERARARPFAFEFWGAPLRRVLARQLATLHGSAAALPQRLPPAEYNAALLSSAFVASPPGTGADCHRHYEILLAGAIPVVLRSGVALATLRALPVLVVDDYSVANGSALEYATREIGRRISVDAATTNPLAPLTAHFWVMQIRRAAQEGGRHNQLLGRRPRPFRLSAPTLAIHLPGSVRGASLHDRMTKQELSSFSTRNTDCPCQCGLCEGSDAQFSPQHHRRAHL